VKIKSVKRKKDSEEKNRLVMIFGDKIHNVLQNFKNDTAIIFGDKNRFL